MSWRQALGRQTAILPLNFLTAAAACMCTHSSNLRHQEAAGILPKDRSRCNTHFNPFMAASSGGYGGGRSGGGGGTPRRSRKKGRRR